MGKLLSIFRELIPHLLPVALLCAGVSCGSAPSGAVGINAVCDSSCSDSGLYRTVSFFNSKALPLRTDSYYLDTTDGQYILCSRMQNIYDTVPRLRRQLNFAADISDMLLRPLELNIYHYDSLNQLIAIQHCMPSDSSSWTNISLDTYTYRDTTKIAATHFQWDNNAWLKISEYHFFYDSVGRLANSISYERDVRDTAKFIKDLRQYFYIDDYKD